MPTVLPVVNTQPHTAAGICLFKEAGGLPRPLPAQGPRPAGEAPPGAGTARGAAGHGVPGAGEALARGRAGGRRRGLGGRPRHLRRYPGAAVQDLVQRGLRAAAGGEAAGGPAGEPGRGAPRGDTGTGAVMPKL